MMRCIALLMCAATSGCIPIMIADSVSSGRDEALREDAAQQSLTQEAIVRANASATGYELSTERAEAVVRAMFNVLEVSPTECGAATVYCGQSPNKEIHFNNLLDALDGGVEGALPIGPWRQTGKRRNAIYSRTFVVDGMQLLELRYWDTHNKAHRVELEFELAMED